MKDTNDTIGVANVHAIVIQGLQESTRYYLEVYGNTLLRPATAKYLARRIKKLCEIPTQTLNCPWLKLEKLKHRDRDIIEDIFK